MTWEMLKQDTYDSGFSAGEEHGFSLGRNEGIAIGEERGISLGEHKKAIETAKNALSMKLTLEQIASLTGLSVEVIQDLADKQIIKNARNYKTERYYINKGKTDGSLAKRL